MGSRNSKFAKRLELLFDDCSARWFLASSIKDMFVGDSVIISTFDFQNPPDAFVIESI